ncbi:MAG: hypothetical protein ACLQIB_17550, partial [Isosphaeraceae bacterium]
TPGASPNAFVPSLGETMRIEGQDATSRIFNTYDYTQMAQPNTDAVQEIAYQTSNYAPEYGQAGTAVINMTMKSGTNQYHGTAFEYFVNWRAWGDNFDARFPAECRYHTQDAHELSRHWLCVWDSSADGDI